VVVANFSDDAQDGYVIGFPAAGTWKLRFNSDWQGYNDDFNNHPSTDIIAEAPETEKVICDHRLNMVLLIWLLLTARYILFSIYS